jgi:hypothetical protein
MSTLRTADKPFLLCRWQHSPCSACDEAEVGLFSRVDHGCVVEVEVAAHETLTVARLHAGRLAKDGTEVTVYDGQGEAVWAQ